MNDHRQTERCFLIFAFAVRCCALLLFTLCAVLRGYSAELWFYALLYAAGLSIRLVIESNRKERG